METKELEQLADEFGSVVVIKEDRPAFVMIPFSKYKDLLSEREDSQIYRHFSKMEDSSSEDQIPEIDLEVDMIEQLNKEIMALKEEIKSRESEESQMSSGDVREESMTEVGQ